MSVESAGEEKLRRAVVRVAFNDEGGLALCPHLALRSGQFRGPLLR